MTKPVGGWPTRQVRSPLTQAMLNPLGKGTQRVVIVDQLRDADYLKLSKLVEGRPDVELRAIGDIRDLDFLKHFSGLRVLEIDDAPELTDISGLGYLSENLESLAIGARLSRKPSVRVLTELSRVRRLYLEGPIKDIDALAHLTGLRDLTLRSITLPSLAIFRPLQHLLSLDIKLGGLTDLSDLPEIGRLRYLELWMVRGLSDLTPIGSVLTLEYLFLQALRRVDRLPTCANLINLRGVCLETMKGIRDPCPLAQAPALEELCMIAMGHLRPTDFTCFLGHPALKFAIIGLGSAEKNRAVHSILPLPAPPPAFGIRWRRATTD